MPPPVKPGTAARYWREVDALSRLEVALNRDMDLSEEERSRLVTSVIGLKALLTELARSRTPANPTGEEGANPVGEVA